MKKVFVPIILVLFIFLALASGCIDRTKETSTTETVQEPAEPTQVEGEPTTKSTCDDGNPCTKDVYNELTNECEHTATKNCCGNDICESGERCDEESHLTVCVEDCTRTCPPFLVVHKTESGKETDVFAMSCGGSGCQQTDENKFRITDSSKVKTMITNIGERSSSDIRSNFMCWSGDEQAIVDGRKVKGVVFEDYFNDNQNELRYINPVQSEGNSATYYLSFNTDEMSGPFLANCKIFIRSIDFEQEQAFTLSFS